MANLRCETGADLNYDRGWGLHSAVDGGSQRNIKRVKYRIHCSRDIQSVLEREYGFFVDYAFYFLTCSLIVLYDGAPLCELVRSLLFCLHEDVRWDYM